MRSIRIKRSLLEQVQGFINEYIAERGDVEDPHIDLREVVKWALETGRIVPHPQDPIKMFLPLFARAARSEKFLDPQGRSVRRKHAVRHSADVDGRQKWFSFWYDIETAPPQHMHVSFQQRRQSIVLDCGCLKTDVDSYNDNNPHGAFIPMSFNIDEDIREKEMPEEYPDKRPEGETQSS